MKSLLASQSFLADTKNQVALLDKNLTVSFRDRLKNIGLLPLTPTSVEIFQINLGKMCNQVCKHCHVDAGPDRKEIMSREVMQQCLNALESSPSIKIVDLTGGAPELNPNFRWFVEELKKQGKHIIVRCNLTIILANKRFHDLPEFYKKHKVEVVSSLPFYSQDRTDRQRGAGIFADSIKALKLLNAVGYGEPDGELKLNLVYNPAGAFLPPSQISLEREYKDALMRDFGIRFNNLYVITNMPISRYLDFLLSSGNYERYMSKLAEAFNPAAAQNVMCRNTISIGYDGYVYDCDFNQMLDLKVSCTADHVKDFNINALSGREIVLKQHCYGCTAGSGSSCGGQVA